MEDGRPCRCPIAPLDDGNDDRQHVGLARRCPGDEALPGDVLDELSVVADGGGPLDHVGDEKLHQPERSRTELEMKRPQKGALSMIAAIRLMTAHGTEFDATWGGALAHFMMQARNIN